jgi:hypothetical protein
MVTASAGDAVWIGALPLLDAFELVPLPIIVFGRLIHPQQRRRNLSTSRLDCR